GVASTHVHAPAVLIHHAQQALPAALALAHRLGPQGAVLASHAQSAFVDGLQVALLIAAGALAAAALFVFWRAAPRTGPPAGVTRPPVKTGRRTGRRPGPADSREAILTAARREFGARGFDGATVRAIATAAGVDPALVMYFFGSKEQLFLAAIELGLRPGEAI